MDGIVGNVRDVIIILTGLCALGALLTVVIAVVKYVGPLSKDLHRMVDKVTETAEIVDKELEHLRGVLQSYQTLSDDLQRSHREHILPALSSLNELTAHVAESAAEISSIVHEGGKFSRETIHRARYYRDTLFRPLIEIASLWSGISAVLNALPKGVLKLPGSKKES